MIIDDEEFYIAPIDCFIQSLDALLQEVQFIAGRDDDGNLESTQDGFFPVELMVAKALLVGTRRVKRLRGPTASLHRFSQRPAGLLHGGMSEISIHFRGGPRMVTNQWQMDDLLWSELVTGPQQ